MKPEQYQPRDFLWSQRDRRWSWKKLGPSPLDCGHYGCASLCATYVIDRYRQTNKQQILYPNQVIDKANYTPGGLIYWNTVELLTNNKVKQTWKKAEARFVLREVVWGAYHHWIVLLDGNLCYNPWTGKIEERDQSIWYPSGREIYYKV